jgi:hypothetical protein
MGVLFLDELPEFQKSVFYNGTNGSIISHLPANNQTSITMPTPYYFNGWSWQDMTLVTNSTKVTQPNYSSMICTYGAPAGLTNTDATTSKPLY